MIDDAGGASVDVELLAGRGDRVTLSLLVGQPDLFVSLRLGSRP